MQSSLLPLFPLEAVAFPGLALPLHIFEERYKEMVRLCLDEGLPFGVLLIKQGVEAGGPARPYDVGTTARITAVVRLPEGRMNLVCAGGQRFRVTERIPGRPYMVGRVELLDAAPDAGPETSDLADTAAALCAEYTRLRLALAGQWARTLEMPGEPDRLADFIASRLGVDNGTKQALLEELSAYNRLSRETEILGEAIRYLTVRVRAAHLARWRGFAVTN